MSSEQQARLIDDVQQAYAAEKLATTVTTAALSRAREAGVPYKLSALAVAEALPLGLGETIERRAARLEDAFRQRVSLHRRKHQVIRDHDQIIGIEPVRPHPAREEVQMRNVIRKTRTVVETSWERVPETEMRSDEGVEALSPEEHEDREVYVDQDEDDEDEIEPERGVSGPLVLLGDEDYE